MTNGVPSLEWRGNKVARSCRRISFGTVFTEKLYNEGGRGSVDGELPKRGGEERAKGSRRVTHPVKFLIIQGFSEGLVVGKERESPFLRRGRIETQKSEGTKGGDLVSADVRVLSTLMKGFTGRSSSTGL